MIRWSHAVALISGALSSLACGASEKKSPSANAANPCGLDTDYPGNENCLLPPAPDEGLQLHIGPESYDDPNVINAVGPDGLPVWLMEPGTERTQCYHLISPNTDERHYFKQQYRMRKGSHHMIIMVGGATTPVVGPDGGAVLAPDGGAVTEPAQEGWWAPADPISQQFCGNLIGAIGGTQSIVEDLPPGGIVAPEDEGLARKMPPRAHLDVQLHFYNSSEEVNVREAWVNFYYKPASEVTQTLGMLGGFGYPMDNDLSDNLYGFQPGVTGSVSKTCVASTSALASPMPVRIVTLFGHAHIHNRRFAVWHEQAATGTRDLVYDSYEGAEGPTFTYNTTAVNPAPIPGQRITGAKTGPLYLEADDALTFTCDIVNDTQKVFLGLNEVADDEMCNLFGSVAGVGFLCQ